MSTTSSASPGCPSQSRLAEIRTSILELDAVEKRELICSIRSSRLVRKTLPKDTRTTKKRVAALQSEVPDAWKELLRKSNATE
jgi:hypothetical protein